MEVIELLNNDAVCKHCFNKTKKNEIFCCVGCEAAYSFIHNLGLEEYYSKRQNNKKPAHQLKLAPEFFDIDFIQEHIKVLTHDLRVCEVTLEGMTCSACVWLLEKIPMIDSRIKRVQVLFNQSAIRVFFTNDIDLKTIGQLLLNLGYTPRLFSHINQSNFLIKEERRELLRLGVAWASMLATMHVSLNLYAGRLTEMSFKSWLPITLANFFISSPAIFYSAKPFYINAIRALKSKKINVDSLVVFSIFSALTASFANIFLKTNETYFEAMSMLIAFLLAGRFFIKKSEQKIKNDNEYFSFIALDKAGRLKEGAMVRVRSGEVFSCDGIVQWGESYMNQSWLTGEALPQKIIKGDFVWAGAINIGDSIEIKVLKSGAQTKLGQVLAKVQSHVRSKVVGYAEKLETAMVKFLVLSLFIFILWSLWMHQPFMSKVVGLIIVMCPCALGIAIPAVFSSAMHQAVKRGILIKGESVFENLSKIDKIVFDKTGTLTDVSPALLSVHWNELILKKMDIHQQDLENLLAFVSERSSHPIMRAFEKQFKKQAQPLFQMREFVGQGIDIQYSNKSFKLGSAMFGGVKTDGKNSVYLTVEGQIIANFELFYDLRDEVNLETELKKWKKKIYIVSGDQKNSVLEVANVLGFESKQVFFQQTPEMKAQIIKNLSETGKVLMVGDGINDTLAFKESLVSVAVTGGAGIALETSDVYLSVPKLTLVFELLSAAKKVKKTIVFNLIWTLLYNIAGAALVLSGAITPIICAIIMPLSSVCVILLATKTKYFSEMKK